MMEHESSADDPPRRLARALRQMLESWAAAGLDRIPRSRTAEEPPALASRAAVEVVHPRTEPDPKLSPLIPPSSPPILAGDRPGRLWTDSVETAAARQETIIPAADRPGILAALAETVAGCPRCPELAACRKQTVFGVGHPAARLVFVGEAPGADEDARGEPFVGRAGQLLTKIITNGMKLRREDVYICNVLKCRPPGNRTPAPDEVANCRGYLERQLEILRPEFICALGNVAAHTLLETTAPMNRLRGKFHAYRGIPVLCTYHPAYLLRNENAKRLVWEDIQKLMAAMGLQAGEKASD